MATLHPIQTEIRNLEHQSIKDPYLLYAMGFRFNTLDYEYLQTEYFVDGRGDKKIDFAAIDFDSGVAVIAQGYTSKDWAKVNVSTNKAADLSIAINWILEGEISDIPREEIRAIAKEVRTGLESREINKIEILYVHNLTTSAEVDVELRTVKRSAEALLRKYSVDQTAPPECIVRQISRETVEEWRRSQHGTISIQEEVQLHSLTTPVVHETAEWKSVLLTVPALDLVDLHRRYGDALSSANVRDYLGSRERSRNINSQIEKTATQDPRNFWIYNNGITLLTHGISEGAVSTLEGVAVINGAQTTGSLRQAADQGSEALSQATVLVRVIKCNDASLIDKVIRYNNTQNPIKAWELRVLDPIQRKLVREFEDLGITYQTRRSQTRRRSTDIHYEKLGPFLAAFYGDPGVAHRNKADLFEVESRYRGLFDEDTHAKNLLFIYRLGGLIQSVKAEYKEKSSSGSANETELAVTSYFRYGAFPFVLLHTCAEVIGSWMSGREPHFRRRVTLPDEILLNEEKFFESMLPFVNAILVPIHQHLKSSNSDAYQVTRSQAGVRELVENTKTLMSSLEQMQPDVYNEIKSTLQLVPS